MPVIEIVWKGSLEKSPENPKSGWAYYNPQSRASYLFDGTTWVIIAKDGADGIPGKDGKSIIWKGELQTEPVNPEENWAYFNRIDGNSYIYNGEKWDYLAKSGRDGASGIMLWLGDFSTPPANPKNGYAYHNTTDKKSYIYNGTVWNVLAEDGKNGADGKDGVDGINGKSIVWKGASDAAPINPENLWAYFNTSNKTTYIFNGLSWEVMAVSLGGDTNITVPLEWKGNFSSAPSDALVGWTYYNTSTKSSYIYDGSVWQKIASDGADGQDGRDGKDGKDGKDGTSGGGSVQGFLMNWKGSYSVAPSSQSAGWAYYNTRDKCSYIFSGEQWQIFAKDGKDGVDGSGGSSGSGVMPSYKNFYIVIYADGNFQVNGSLDSEQIIDFGTVGLGCSRRTSNFMMGIQSSTKNDTLELTGTPTIQISGEDADNFVITQPTQKIFDTAQTASDAVIAFCPTSVGKKTATVTIPNDSLNAPNFSFTVTGEAGYFPKYFDGGEGDGNDSITCALHDSQGNLYFIGYGFELVNNHSGFDWWIKKIDIDGSNEIWEKKLDHYDDYSSYSPSYDYPRSAIIDSDDNLIVTGKRGDGYSRTYKFSSSGAELWNVGIGGDLYCDSQDNIIIMSSQYIRKYSPQGSLLWKRSFVNGKVAFNDNDDLFCCNENTVAKINSDGSTVWKTKPMTSIGRVDDYVSDAKHYKYNVTSGQKYILTWDDRYNKTLQNDKTAMLNVSAFYESTGNSQSFSRENTFTAKESGNLIVEVAKNYYSGTYSLAMYKMYDGSSLSSTDWENGIFGTDEAWREVTLNADEKTFTIPVINGHKYEIQLDDRGGSKTYDLDAKIKCEDANGISIFSYKDSCYSSPATFTATKTGNVVVTIAPWNSSGAGTVAWRIYESNEKNSETYEFSVTKGRPYIVLYNDSSYGDGTKTARIKITEKYKSGLETIINDRYYSFYTKPELFFAKETGVVTVDVNKYDSSASYNGSYSVALKELEIVQPYSSFINFDDVSINSVCCDSSGEIYVTGRVQNKADTHSKKDAIIKKFDANGVEVTTGWNKIIDWGHCDDEAGTMIIFDGTNIVVLGEGYDLLNGASEKDTWVKVFSTSGTEMTNFIFGSSNAVLLKMDTSAYWFKDDADVFKYSLGGILLKKYVSPTDYSARINDAVATINTDGKIYIAGYGNDLVNAYSGHDWNIYQFE